MTTHFFYEDHEVYLRALEPDDLKGDWPAWFNDPDVTRFSSGGYYPNSVATQETYFDKVSKSDSDVVLAIIERGSERHVGNVGLHRIERIHRTAYLGIVLGDKSVWGRGIGARCWRAITDYGFSVLNLHKICATILDGNVASMKCAERSGFRVEGRQVKQMYKNGSYVDVFSLGLLREDWLVARQATAEDPG